MLNHLRGVRRVLPASAGVWRELALASWVSEVEKHVGRNSIKIVGLRSANVGLVTSWYINLVHMLL